MLHLVTAVIKPHKLEEVKEALEALSIQGMTVTEVLGHGRQRGHTETYRGAEYQVDLLPKMKIEVVVDSSDAESIANAILAAAQTGSIGDGKIWLTPVDRLYRVRTAEQGIAAL
jgi:nitrogen regulatory protein P-II 1